METLKFTLYLCVLAIWPMMAVYAVAFHLGLVPAITVLIPAIAL